MKPWSLSTKLIVTLLACISVTWAWEGSSEWEGLLAVVLAWGIGFAQGFVGGTMFRQSPEYAPPRERES